LKIVEESTLLTRDPKKKHSLALKFPVAIKHPLMGKWALKEPQRKKVPDYLFFPIFGGKVCKRKLRHP
jgi:hypothetical protein